MHVLETYFFSLFLLFLLSYGATRIATGACLMFFLLPLVINYKYVLDRVMLFLMAFESLTFPVLFLICV